MDQELKYNFAKIFERFDSQDARLDKMDTRFDRLDARLDKMDARLDRVEQSIHRQGILFEDLSQKIDAVYDVVLANAETLKVLNRHESVLEKHEHRISALEAAGVTSR